MIRFDIDGIRFTYRVAAVAIYKQHVLCLSKQRDRTPGCCREAGARLASHLLRR